MNFLLYSTLLGFVINSVLGLLVLSMNPRRRANRCFFGISLAIMAWQVTLLGGALSYANPALLLFWIRQASIAAGLIPVTFDFMRLGIQYPDQPWRRLLPQLRPWAVALLGLIILCNTEFFVYDSQPGESGFAVALYGPGHYLYILFWLAALGLLVYRFQRALRIERGIARTELQYIVLAAVASVSLGLFLSHAVPLFFGHAETPQLTPLLATLLSAGIIAYGIATRRILSVGDVLRRLTAYTLLGAYLSVVYLVVFSSSLWFVRHLALAGRNTAHWLAALAVAFSVVPAQGRLQRFANRLLGRRAIMDVAGMLRAAHQAALALGTPAELCARFAGLLREATGTTRLVVCLCRDGIFQPVYHWPEERGAPPPFTEDNPVAAWLRKRNEPTAADMLRRLRPTTARTAVSAQLRAWQLEVAIGIHTPGRLAGVILLGPRLTAGIYTAAELDALQLLGNQLAVALDNAKLYTEVQQARSYQELLLNALDSGIVAAGPDQTITAFNHEAERLTGLCAADVIGRRTNILPRLLAEALTRTLATGAGGVDDNALLAAGAPAPVPVRLSALLFRDPAGEVTGALAVFQDLSRLRKLEEQLRRTDRLSSLGTLAAGMAHEIKNPLVTIKTFTQLLPERFTDAEFRETFTNLVGAEVARIDSLVNRLLHFARPAAANLQPLRLHAVLDPALQLVDQPLRAHNIHLQAAPAAPQDEIFGDAELLNQALVNIFLNAVQAMPEGGALTVRTDVTPVFFPARTGAKARDAICIQVRDTGCGITPEDLPHIFDPFFTRSANGTGLGLSIAHDIIREHHGLVEVQSGPNEGAMFSVYLPITETEGAA